MTPGPAQAKISVDAAALVRPSFTALPPLALYVHIPWCIKKCPYCDFNSNEVRGDAPEEGLTPLPSVEAG